MSKPALAKILEWVERVNEEGYPAHDALKEISAIAALEASSPTIDRAGLVKAVEELRTVKVLGAEGYWIDMASVLEILNAPSSQKETRP